jgi:predicted dehydrogenase/nucleoside-diphosphate-sugar epimerase
MKKQQQIGIIGTGYIANVHAEVLKNIPGVDIVGVYDIQQDKARNFAQKYHIPKVFNSSEEIIAGKLCDTVHVVVPPAAHKAAALPFLQAGIDVFLEKPMAVSSLECQELVQAAERSGAKLGINHNFKYYPAFLRCKQILADGSLGHIHHAISYWNVPLRQLLSKSFGHWMFQSPGNIILEQAVHPLSQLLDLAGDTRTLQVIPSGRTELAPGSFFFDTWQISMDCEQATAQLFFSVGQDFPSIGLVVICEDGQILVDNVNNWCVVQRKTRWPEFFNSYLNGRNMVSRLTKDNLINLKNFVLSTANLQPPSDAFMSSMRQSATAFYTTSPGTRPYVDGKTGARMIAISEQIIAEVEQSVAATEKPALNTNYQGGAFDALLIGGTGFIGKKTVEHMVKAGKRLLVASRNIRMLPAIFYHPNVTVVSVDIVDQAKIREIIANIPVVIHLAHGGGGDTWAELQKTMIGGTRNIAEACLEHGTKRLIYIGTIASLYLGDPNQIISDKTPVDPQPDKRGLYSKGKTECERILLELHKQRNLPVCILRPGVVIGEGGLPFHSGIGMFNQDTYCIGWNQGQNELPLVLVEDVAAAIVLAAFTETPVIGKAYNVVGDVRFTAREYMAELGKVLGRKLRYLPQAPLKIQAVEIGKWLIKRMIQHRQVDFPSYRDLLTRGLVARFDCIDLKTELGWKPETNREAFISRGIAVYSKQ